MGENMDRVFGGGIKSIGGLGVSKGGRGEDED